MRDKAPAADWGAVACERSEFIRIVKEQGALHYRDLPWRNIDDAYAVLVSEVMLQQTQVSRVCDYWPRFMKAFPSVDALASASTSDVLDMWQGLGYNRRALALKRACDICAAEYGGKLPVDRDGLIALPGIGLATAAGVLAFAYDRPGTYIETNVRSVFLHHLFPDVEEVPDKLIEPYVRDTCPESGARAWYYALLDYGAHLKSTVQNPSRRSAHYARQSAFAGSHREKRSFILKCVLGSNGSISAGESHRLLNEFERSHGRDDIDDDAFESLVRELVNEGFFIYSEGTLIP